MISPEQEQWLEHLDSSNQVTILPFDARSKARFAVFKKQVQELIGEGKDIVHRGASSLGISGQGELDVYIPVRPQEFDAMVALLKSRFGTPGSVYPGKRARFNARIEDTKVELFVINKDDRGWTESCLFEDYLRITPEALRAYEVLKESAAGQSTREYYRRKIAFINETIAKAQAARS